MIFAALAAGLIAVAQTQADAVLARAIPEQSAGCAVSVLQNDRVVYASARGLANLDDGLPLTEQSVFYIASDSKQFTAFAVGLLVDRGIVRLDDPVTKWIPELPADVYGRVTIGDLVHHTGGVRDYWGLRDLQGISSTAPLSQADFLRLVAAQRSLNFLPGSRFGYSNSGYALLAIVVARASGETLGRFADTEIFAPLKMSQTSYGADHLAPLSGLAAGYDVTEGVYRRDAAAMEPLGDGGVRTTVGDLMQWLRNFADNRLGSHPDAVMQLAQTPGRLKDGSTVHYAFGMALGARDGYAMFDHTGSYAGYQAFIAWLPAPRLGVAALCNADGAGFSAWTVGLSVLDLFLGRAPSSAAAPAAAAPPAVTLSPPQLAKLKGTYTEPDGTVWEILADSAIHARVQGLEFALQPIDQSHLRAVGAPQAIEITIENSTLSLVVGNGPSEPLTHFVPPVLTTAQFRRYSGTYHSDELNVTLRVYAERGQLYLARDLTPPQVLKPVSRDLFAIGPRTLQFERDAHGSVTAIVLSASGVDSLRVRRV